MSGSTRIVGHKNHLDVHTVPFVERSSSSAVEEVALSSLSDT